MLPGSFRCTCHLLSPPGFHDHPIGEGKIKYSPEKCGISFQSRLGKGWLEPFTDIRLEELPKAGVKKLLIVCPAFVSDCLETLEEIAERGKETLSRREGNLIP